MSDSPEDEEFLFSFFFKLFSLLAKTQGCGLHSGSTIISGVTWTCDSMALDFSSVIEGKHHLHRRGCSVVHPAQCPAHADTQQI